MVRLPARTLVAGEVRGPLLVLDTPLSFWGGLDPATGRIIDRSHPACGRSVQGCILVMPSGRGSSSSSSVLAEAIRCHTGPAGIVLALPDPIIVVGALVARQLYGLACPVVVAAGTAPLRTGGAARIAAPAGAPASVELLERPDVRSGSSAGP
jgi:predicted aconitase with swiveling domain